MSRPAPQSYLLRLWREHPDAPVRATLIAVGQPDAHQHFADLNALCAFLRAGRRRTRSVRRSEHDVLYPIEKQLKSSSTIQAELMLNKW